MRQEIDYIDPDAEGLDLTDKTIVVYCGSGGRAALCGQTLKEYGYKNVRSLGSLKDWVDAGGEVEKS